MRTKGQLELAKEAILELLQFPRLKASFAASIATPSSSSSSDFFKLISNPKGILILGESGVGKSSLVHEVCSLMRLELVSVSTGELLALPHVGAAEEMLREAFQEAEGKAKENGKENLVGMAVVFIGHIVF
jgi:SpoVK/Ycf46/Vps4 family AAA+-type ATPase